MSNISYFKDLYYTIKGTRLYHKILKKSCYWSSDKMALYQFEKLKYLLIESYNGIPYYRELFDSHGFNPKTDFERLSDLAKLPILSKEFVKTNKDLFVNENHYLLIIEFYQ